MQRDLESFLRGAWHLPIRAVHQGTRIITQGEEGDQAYIIVSGTCAVVRYLDGTRRVVRELGPGDVFGELAILTDKPRSAHVDALTPVELMVVTRSTLSEAIGLDSWVGRFVRALAERFRELDARVEKRQLRLHRQEAGSLDLSGLGSREEPS
jgi:serine/threonine-protein kinase